jgi:beta-glucosidase
VVPAGTAALWVGGGQPGGARPAAGAAVTLTVQGQEVLKAF